MHNLAVTLRDIEKDVERFWKDGAGADGSIFWEATWYFRNDVGNSNLHWIKVNVERKLERIRNRSDVIVALQYGLAQASSSIMARSAVSMFRCEFSTFAALPFQLSVNWREQNASRFNFY